MKYDVKIEGKRWVVDNSIYPEQGYYIDDDSVSSMKDYK